MKKSSMIIMTLLFLLCFTLSISSLSMSARVSDNDCLSDYGKEGSRFDTKNYLNSFDVVDFASKGLNTLDINAINYPSNSIAIANSSFVISDELLTEMNMIIRDYGVSSSFYVIDLDSNMSIAYNVDNKYETASSIKAVYALYIYKEIAKGNIDPNRKIVYEERYYNKGTGVVKNSDFNTEFTVRDLVYYSLYESDNIAYEMLHGTFGVAGYNEMLRNIGTKELYLTAGNPWGYNSPRSAALIWQELYNFSISSSEGIELFNILANAKYNYYKEVRPDLQSAGKAGFASKSVLQTGIVFDKHPYICIVMANRGGQIGAYTQVIKLIDVIDKVMQEYYGYLEDK